MVPENRAMLPEIPTCRAVAPCFLTAFALPAAAVVPRPPRRTRRRLAGWHIATDMLRGWEAP